MWNPFAEFVETWRQLFNPSVRKAWHLNLDTSGLVADGQFLEASVVGARALALNEALYGTHHPEIAYALENLGYALDGLGKVEQAKPLFERARARYEACYGPSHPKVAGTLNSLGRIARELGDLPKAQTLHERALAMQEACYGTEAPEVAISLRDLGDVLEEMGDFSAAKERYERALSISERSYAEYGGDTYPIMALDERLARVRHRLEEDGSGKDAPLRAQTLRERDAEVTRVSEVHRLGRVQHPGKALSSPLH
jgi:tetratricopeptide (TPR) repeat protein